MKNRKEEEESLLKDQLSLILTVMLHIKSMNM